MDRAIALKRGSANVEHKAYESQFSSNSVENTTVENSQLESPSQKLLVRGPLPFDRAERVLMTRLLDPTSVDNDLVFYILAITLSYKQLRQIALPTET